MSKVISVFLFLVLAVPFESVAQELRGVNAGVIAYACRDGGAEYLLAYDPDYRRRGWGAFGGQPDVGEPAKRTARRELRQETNCVFTEDEVAAIPLRGPSISNNFYTYVGEVPYRAAPEISTPRSCRDVERAFWVWVPHQPLMDALNSTYKEPKVNISGTPPTELHLWHGAAESMRKALSDGYLSMANPCRS